MMISSNTASRKFATRTTVPSTTTVTLIRKRMKMKSLIFCVMTSTITITNTFLKSTSLTIIPFSQEKKISWWPMQRRYSDREETDIRLYLKRLLIGSKLSELIRWPNWCRLWWLWRVISEISSNTLRGQSSFSSSFGTDSQKSIVSQDTCLYSIKYWNSVTLSTPSISVKRNYKYLNFTLVTQETERWWWRRKGASFPT